MSEELVILEPYASSLIESMRSIGYSFETAIADIIDNSISAKATEIKIYQRVKNGIPYIQIIDDGIGMSRSDLLDALRLGSKNPTEDREKDDLGRFGLGLKSASFSQCRILTVVSKMNNEIHGFQWDLDIVAKTNRFVVRELDEFEISSFSNLSYLSEREGGTIVQWENFDRINDSTHDLQNELADLMIVAIEHISLIFHRFLNSKLTIQVNNEKVVPKDPFLKNNGGTQERPIEKIKIEGETITLNPYILPHLSKLSVADKRLAGKANEYYKSQGFYLYRNKRLIVWGSYLGVSRKTELGKNLRIQVDIPNSLDYLWEVDVKKSRANVPSIIRKNLSKAIVDGENVSKRVYTFRGNREVTDNESMWSFFSDRDNKFHFEINTENPLYKQLVYTMDDDEYRLFQMYLKTLSENLPIQKIYAEVADGKGNVGVQDENLTEDLKAIVEQVKSIPTVDVKEILKSLLSTEPYKSNDVAVNYINRELGEL